MEREEIDELYQRLNSLMDRKEKIANFIKELGLEEEELDEIRGYMGSSDGITQSIIGNKRERISDRSKSYMSKTRRLSQRMLTNKVINFDA